MSLEKIVMDYIHNATGGMVNIPPAVAENIIALVRGQFIEGTAKAMLYRYNEQRNEYELIFTHLTTDQQIDQVIIEAAKKSPVHQFYLYRLLKANGQLAAKIFSANQNLFQ